MPGYVEDRWFTKRPDPTTGQRRKTARHGQGKRWRVAGIPGVRSRCFTNLDGKNGAKAWLAKAQNESAGGEFYDPRDGNITLRWYVEEKWWPSLRVPPGTRESMRSRIFNHILPHVGDLPLNRISSDEIKAWLARVEKDIDTSTAHTTWQHFSAIMQAAHKAKRVPANPFRDEDLRAPTVPKSKAKAWRPETVAAVREALAARYRILVDLAVGAGLRQGETFGFSPDDIDGDEITVVRQVVKIGGKLAFAPPKGNKERRAPCPPELAEAVKRHMRLFEPVFVTLPWVDPDRPNLEWKDRPGKTVRLLVTTTRTRGVSGGAVNRTTFGEKAWKPALVRAGVVPEPKVEYVHANGKQPWRRVEWEMPREDGFHALRHTFASIVLHAGETVQQLAEWLGHGDPAFTYRTYVHFLPDSGRKALTALGGWVAGGALKTECGPGPVEDWSPQETRDLVAALAARAGVDAVPDRFREAVAALLAQNP